MLTKSRPLDLAEIQSRLPDRVQFVQYAVLPDRLAIWIVSRTRFDFVEQQISATALAEKIESYQASIAGKDPPANIRRAGVELYGLLIPPNLASYKQLCLIPDKSLR